MQGLPHLREVDAGELLEDEVGEQGDQCGGRDVSQGDATQLLGLWLLDIGRVGNCVANLLDELSRLVDGATSGRTDRRQLEVRKRRSEGDVPEPGLRGIHRSLDTDHRGEGDQELRHVDADTRLTG